MNGFNYLCTWQKFSYNSYVLAIVTRSQKLLLIMNEDKKNTSVIIMIQLHRKEAKSLVDFTRSQIKSLILGMGSFF